MWNAAAGMVDEAVYEDGLLEGVGPELVSVVLWCCALARNRYEGKSELLAMSFRCTGRCAKTNRFVGMNWGLRDRSDGPRRSSNELVLRRLQYELYVEETRGGRERGSIT